MELILGRSSLYLVSIPKILFYIGTRDLGVDGGDFTLRPKMGEKCHKRHLLKISYTFDIMYLAQCRIYHKKCLFSTSRKRCFSELTLTQIEDGYISELKSGTEQIREKRFS